MAESRDYLATDWGEGAGVLTGGLGNETQVGRRKWVSGDQGEESPRGIWWTGGEWQ